MTPNEMNRLASETGAMPVVRIRGINKRIHNLKWSIVGCDMVIHAHTTKIVGLVQKHIRRYPLKFRHRVVYVIPEDVK